jgi:glycosyltransferase involved in cell wall biosynthesis
VIPGLVSVIIPSYNHGRFIGRALQSLLDQSYVSWEAIVVDNHSSDDTDAVIGTFIDPRIRVRKIRNEGIIAVSRNHGLHEARGEWVAFLDSDDWWTPDKLARCLEAATGATPADVVYHQLRVVDEHAPMRPRKVIPSWTVTPPAWRHLVLHGNPIANSSVVVRAHLLQQIGGLREDRALVATEDFNAWIRIAQLTDRFRYLPEPLGFYLVHGSGMSQRDMSTAYAAATEEFVADLLPAERRRRTAQVAYIQGRHRYLCGEFSTAREPLGLALRHGSILPARRRRG